MLTAIMKSIPTHSVLLIRPPVVCPVMPGLFMATAAGMLRNAGMAVHPYDAGLDFALVHALRESPEADVQEKAARILASEDFYQPNRFIAVKEKINKQLLSFSQERLPHRIRWNSWAPSPKADPRQNDLFAGLCRSGLDERIKRITPGIVIFCLSTQEQCFSAATMAGCIQSRYPDIELGFVVKDRHLLEQMRPLSDPPMSVVPETISAFLKDRFDIPGDGHPPLPDFSGLPLASYLSPGVVLPVDGSRFSRPDDLRRYMLKQTGQARAAGIGIHNPGGMMDGLPESVKRLYLSCRQTAVPDPPLPAGRFTLQDLVNRGLLLVEWQVGRARVPDLSKQMWKLSKSGVWNHVVLPADTDTEIKKEWCRFITSNPNIAHSYTAPDATVSFERFSDSRIDPSHDTYSTVCPVPGKPFWQYLEHPAHILLYLDRFGKDTLFCMRAAADKGGVFTIGEKIEFHFKPPGELTGRQMDEICRMVEAGGSVDPTYVRYNLERAFLIGYAEEKGVIVGNSSLKHPRDVFIRRMNKISGLDFTDFVERGYTSVRPEYRALGVGTRLLAGLTRRAGDRKVFSIISEDNAATIKIALKNNTRRIATYYSEKLGKQAGIWMPEHMIEDHWNIPL